MDRFQLLTTNPYVYGLFVIIIGIVGTVGLLLLFRTIKTQLIKNNYIPPKAEERPPLLIAFAISWFFAFTLGCVFTGGPLVAITERKFDLDILKGSVLMMVLPPIGLFVSTLCALFITPLAAWALRTGRKNIVLFGPLLWLFLASFIVWSEYIDNGYLAFLGTLFLSAVGLGLIGLIPPKK